jgi:hypothetical protein
MHEAQEDVALVDHLGWQLKMTVCTEQQSKLEIEVRYRDLKKTVYNCANDVATGWYTNCFHSKLVPPNIQLSKEEYAHLVS